MTARERAIEAMRGLGHDGCARHGESLAMQRVRIAIEAAVAQEREACAALAESMAPGPVEGFDTRVIHGTVMAKRIAEAIRGRG